MRYISAFFNPLIIPTYAIVVAMWITPLQRIPETTRIVASLTVLLLTAIPPLLSVAALGRYGKRESEAGKLTRKISRIPTVIFIICQLCAAFYLYSIYAPEWLVMILVAGGVASLTYLVVGCFISISGHLCGMGSFFAILYYLGINDISDIVATPWLVAVVLLSGLLATARLKLKRHTLSEVGLGYLAGVASTYIILNIHLFDSKLPPV